MNITGLQNEMVDNFSLFEGDMEQTLLYLMDLGNKLPAMPEKHKSDEFLVKGCQSKVWIYPVFKDGKVMFEADSNTAITKGLVYLLWRIWNGQPPEDIVHSELFFMDKIGMGSMIGSQRSNGFAGMIQTMKTYALAFLPKENT